MSRTSAITLKLLLSYIVTSHLLPINYAHAAEDPHQYQLDELVGSYGLSVESFEIATVDLSVENGNLVLHDLGGNRHNPRRETSGIFVIDEPFRVDISFSRGLTGEIENMLMASVGSSATLTRVEILRAEHAEFFDYSVSSAFSSSYSTPIDLSDGISVAPVTELSQHPEPLFRLLEHLNEKAFGLTDSFLIMKDGKLIFEYYDSYSGKYPHEMQSISKSVTSLLMGVAIAEGHIGSVQDSIDRYLPEYSQYFEDEKAEITIEDLLTMSSGLFTNENVLLYANPENVRTREMEASDSIAYTLDLEMVSTPGNIFSYSGGSVTLIGEIIRNATGEDSTLEYFNKSPLGKLNFNEFRWDSQSDGRLNTAGGLFLIQRDLIKIGQLVWQEGMWNGEQLIDRDWIRLSTSPKLPTPQIGTEYGYYWWNRSFEFEGKSLKTIAAMGYGGQLLMLIPELDLIVVTTALNYDSISPVDSIVQEWILPAFL